MKHHQNEMSTHDTKSRLNEHEAELIVELCRYLILQGYEKSQVTILTTYSGQLHRIQDMMRKHEIIKGVRSTVVDNYQGEECDIILLSFVRSNEEGKIGFLQDAHRVNVALSRAKKGLYCTGNFDCLAENSTLWKDIISDLNSRKAIGSALEIYCQNHPERTRLIKSKDDFDAAARDGGCSEDCNYRLPCGHACEKKCHSIDSRHEAQFKICSKQCEKQMHCEYNHQCAKMCHYAIECGRCKAIIEKRRPQCQHIVKCECSGDPSLIRCASPCEKNRSCGHKCENLCSANCEEKPCQQQVRVQSACSHEVIVECSDAENTIKKLNACTQPCDFVLKCGHLCKGSCGRCKIGRLHIA